MTHQLIHNIKLHRFEWHQNKKIAFLSYILPDKQTISFNHTYVPEELAGRGIGGHLAEAGLQYAAGNHLQVESSCSFITAYLQKKGQDH